eukprot:2471962-Prymnesium_polylepis.1
MWSCPKGACASGALPNASSIGTTRCACLRRHHHMGLRARGWRTIDLCERGSSGARARLLDCSCGLSSGDEAARTTLASPSRPESPMQPVGSLLLPAAGVLRGTLAGGGSDAVSSCRCVAAVALGVTLIVIASRFSTRLRAVAISSSSEPTSCCAALLAAALPNFDATAYLRCARGSGCAAVDA